MARSDLVAALVAAVLGFATLSSCSSDDREPADLPGAMLWTDAGGKIQPTTAVVGEVGPAHCEWQSATFLHLGGGIRAGGRQYLRDPEGVVPGRLATTYAPKVDLPSDARDTGFRRDGAELWVASDAVYVVAANGAERWPQTVDGIGCA